MTKDKPAIQTESMNLAEDIEYSQQLLNKRNQAIVNKLIEIYKLLEPELNDKEN